MRLTQSAVVLEKLIGQFLFNKASAGGARTTRSETTRDAARASRAARSRCGRLRDDRRGARSARSARAASTARCTSSTSRFDEPSGAAGGARPTRPCSARRSAAGVAQLLRQHRGHLHRRQQFAAGQARATASTTGRASRSTRTFGLLGINDVASDMGLEKHNEDFGQTFGRWGIAAGSVPVPAVPRLDHGARRHRHRDRLRTSAPLTEVARRSPCATRSTALCCVDTRADLLDAEPHPRGGGARPVHVPARRLPAAAAQPRSTMAARRARSRGRLELRTHPIEQQTLSPTFVCCVCVVLRVRSARRRAARRSAPDALVKRVTLEVVRSHRQGQGDPGRRPRQAGRGHRDQGAAALRFHRDDRARDGPNWGKATPEQKKRLTDEFRTLLVRTYSSALAAYRDQKIDFRPLRAEADRHRRHGATCACCSPARSRCTIDYSMEKTAERLEGLRRDGRRRAAWSPTTAPSSTTRCARRRRRPDQDAADEEQAPRARDSGAAKTVIRRDGRTHGA